MVETANISAGADHYGKTKSPDNVPGLFTLNPGEPDTNIMHYFDKKKPKEDNSSGLTSILLSLQS
jgi:hypothetical protein